MVVLICQAVLAQLVHGGSALLLAFDTPMAELDGAPGSLVAVGVLKALGTPKRVCLLRKITHIG